MIPEGFYLGIAVGSSALAQCTLHWAHAYLMALSTCLCVMPPLERYLHWDLLRSHSCMALGGGNLLRLSSHCAYDRLFTTGIYGRLRQLPIYACRFFERGAGECLKWQKHGSSFHKVP